MEKHICDDKNGLGYTLYLDYYLPELELLEDEEAHYRKYGMIRKAYLKEHRKPHYQMLLLQGKFNEHLNRVDREVHDKMRILITHMVEKQGITEQLKAEQPMLYVQGINGIRNSAEEVVFKEIICK